MVEGTQGIGVVLAETRQAAESVIDAFRGLNGAARAGGEAWWKAPRGSAWCWRRPARRRRA
ncbi:hypothetical protein CJ430_31520 [Klebsiella pneumoniae]|nr:hypothetical protein CJ430_31520 [Klebsiella pneumoniae]